MKHHRYRTLHRSFVLLVGLACVASPLAYAERKCADAFGEARFGPFRAQPARPPEAADVPLAKRQTHRFMSYNLENLFYSVGKWTGGHRGAVRKTQGEAKSPEASQRLGQIILETDPDFVSVQEVENIDALKRFAKEYLNDQYEAFLIEGNDVRGIDVGFLVRRGMPYVYEYISHKDFPGDSVGERVLFSRDLPVLLVREATQPNGPPIFGLSSTHFKSKRDREGDPESRTLRGAQVAGAVHILQEYWERKYPGLPMALLGDFNGSVNEEDEFRPLTTVGRMQNAFRIVKPPVTGIDEVTHTYHPPGGPTHAAEMDAMFVNEGLAAAVTNAFVYRYRGVDGQPKPIPDSFAERSTNPSDHFPIVVDVAYPVLWASYQRRR